MKIKPILRSLGLILVATLLWCSGCSNTDSARDDGAFQDHWKRLIILHTNDMHGQVLPLSATWLKDRDPVPDSGGVVRVAAYVKMVKEQADSRGEAVLVVDTGDWFQGTPEGGIGNGLPFLQIMEQVGYDAMTVGNHEFDHGVQVLLNHLEEVRVPALLANVSEPSGRFLKGTRPYVVVERAGLRIALVGLLTPETPSITHPSASTLHWADPAKVLRSLQEDLKDDVDWILPLTHQGYLADLAFVREVPGYPLVIGGHSHTLLAHGKRVGDTWIAHAGSKAIGVGRIEVWVDPSTDEIKKIIPSVVNLYEETTAGFSNVAVDELSLALLERSEQRMGVVVGRLNGDLMRGRSAFKTSTQGNWITDVMRAQTGADVALQNRGGLRSNLPAGPVTRRDVYRMLPFNNTVVVLTMQGREFEALMRRTVEHETPVTLEFSGMELGVKRSNSGNQMTSLTIGGQALDGSRSYKVATNSFMAGGGGGFSEFADVGERADGGILQRDLIEMEFQQKPQGIVAPAQNRYGQRGH
ncbi:MAG: bifunctional metallophosphatase/5'-nucleotidase [bacterium]|nr:bifunctional metallophosphatase/5'-nucleotidase [bacterium]